jgi:hypothetical protein
LTLYLKYVLALMRPGHKVPSFTTVPPHAAKVGDLSHHNADQLGLIIEEGRRKLDQQSERFDRVRQTAQVILPLGVALLVVVGTELTRIQAERSTCLRAALYTGWGLSAALVLLSVLGSAAILVVRASFGSVLPTLLSQCEPEHLHQDLAEAYVSQTVAGEDTVNTRITLQWWSVFLLSVGGIVYGVIWAVRVL